MKVTAVMTTLQTEAKHVQTHLHFSPPLPKTSTRQQFALTIKGYHDHLLQLGELIEVKKKKHILLLQLQKLAWSSTDKRGHVEAGGWPLKMTPPTSGEFQNKRLKFGCGVTNSNQKKVSISLAHSYIVLVYIYFIIIIFYINILISPGDTMYNAENANT